VIVLVGRFAGRKAVVLRHFEEGTKERKFAHALVAGIERYPRKLTKAMNDEQKEARMAVKPFVKFVNLQHVMPTRYNLVSARARAERERGARSAERGAGTGAARRCARARVRARKCTSLARHAAEARRADVSSTASR